MEHINTETITNSALHSGGKPDVLWEGDNRKEGKLDLGGKISEWHEYTLVWDSTYIRTYVDGKLNLDTKLGDWSSIRAPDNKHAPFDQPFVVILNLAIGGKWPTPDGKAPPADGFPYKYEIQYMRVYDVV
jgi:beta-glucanase (GH16 family)